MRLTRRALVVVGLLAAVAAITIWGPAWLIAGTWVIVAITIMGAGMNRSPSIQVRGRVNRIDSGAGVPAEERRVKR
jgi:hypothetical protein